MNRIWNIEINVCPMFEIKYELNKIHCIIFVQVTFAIKISLVTSDKSHETLFTNDKGYSMKEKIDEYTFIIWFHCIHIVTCDYDATILVTIEANDVLPHVLILNYLNNNNNNFEII
jgi:hypothetical protein